MNTADHLISLSKSQRRRANDLTLQEFTKTTTSTTLEQDRLASITAHVESAAHTFISAINSRDFDIDSPSWRLKSADFRADVEYLPGSDGGVDLAEYTRLTRALVERFPEYHCRILEILTHVEQGGVANCWVDLEVTGCPMGIRRRSANCLKFRRDATDGEWRCVRHECLRGMGMVGGEVV